MRNTSSKTSSQKALLEESDEEWMHGYSSLKFYLFFIFYVNVSKIKSSVLHNVFFFFLKKKKKLKQICWICFYGPFKTKARVCSLL